MIEFSAQQIADFLKGSIIGDPEVKVNNLSKIEDGKPGTLTFLSNPKYNDTWEVYPFNSGYFMCLRIKNVDSEKLRMHLLENYGVGTISVTPTDLRIAFSCLEVDQIQELFDILYQGCKDLTAK